ncbi:MAG: hypothetical protein O6945_15740 [Gammaproteobacteria bacterium]|nr:hypothetical protein [Gammaproteobacteria bacterium]
MFTRIYALAVCFASILCIAISTGIGLYDMVQITFPKLTMDSYLYQNLQSNEAYRQSHLYPGRMPIYPVMINQGGSGISRAASISNPNDEDPLSDEEVTQRRQQQITIAIDNVRHDALRSLMQILIVLLVSIPLFIVHWRFAQKLDAQKSI